MKRNHRGEYPSDWKLIAATVKAEAGGKCARCGHVHEVATGYVLTVHHLDLDKSNCRWWNLAPLCQRCHLQIQGKVIMERPWLLPHSEWFKPYVAGYYAFHHGLPDDRNSVMAQIDYLISLGQATQPQP